ncbi:MAG: matrixin family metalloprotease [Myxococcales bacterium]|nr:matrixin family metalloprotease [Myxococcales bacterium]
MKRIASWRNRLHSGSWAHTTRWWVLGIIFGLCLSSSPVDAFECLAACDNPPCIGAGNPRLTQAWNQRCIPFWIRQNDPLFTSQDHENAVLEAFAQWGSKLNNCTDLQLVFAGYTNDGAGFGPDPKSQKNVILSVTDPDEARSLFGTNASNEPDPSVLAITITMFSPLTGEIFDADIVLNAVANRFYLVEDQQACIAEDSPRPNIDLRNTLTHEVGHFIGFDHVGDPNATMFPSSLDCETNKRSLSADDQDAVCVTYPANQAVRTCVPPENGYAQQGADQFRRQCENAFEEGCGCRTSPRDSGPSPSVIIGIVTLLVFITWRQRRFLS